MFVRSNGSLHAPNISAVNDHVKKDCVEKASLGRSQVVPRAGFGDIDASLRAHCERSKAIQNRIDPLWIAPSSLWGSSSMSAPI